MKIRNTGPYLAIATLALPSISGAADLVWNSGNAANTVWTTVNVWNGPATWVNGDSATFNSSATVNLGSAITQSGITIAAGETLTLNNTTDVKITGTGGITGNLTKTGNSVLRLSHSGGFSGTLGINGQWVVLGSNALDPTGQTSNLTRVNIAAGGLILGSAYNDATGTTRAVIGELSGTGSVRTDWQDGGTNALRTLEINQATDSTFSGTFNQGSGGRILGLEKSGSGVLNISNNVALAAVSGPIAVSGGTMKISGATGTASPLNGTGTLSISSGATFEAANSTSGIPSGITKTITGDGVFLRNGTGNLVISGTNNAGFTGTWKATSGTFGFNSETSIGGAGVELDGGGIFMNGNGVGISSAKTITLGNGGGFFDGSTAWSQTWSASITGTGGLTKRSGMLLVLDGSNDYAGNTIVEGGTLRINGTQTGTGSVNVNAGTRLEGTGSVAGVLNVSGVLAPGASIESFGSASVSFTTGSTFAYELDSSALNGDLLSTSGTLDIANGTILTLTELASGVLAEGSKLTLISYSGGWADTELFTYLGSTLNDDSTFTLGSNTWLFNYNDTIGGLNFGGDQSGATSFVTMTVVPEPGILVMGSFGLLALFRRRRAW